MKKFVIIFLVLLMTASYIYAGPFGLSNGMTLEEVTEACGGCRPERIDNDDRYVIQPEKSHSMFKFYIAWISEEYGLYYVKGISDDLKTNEYGEEIKNRFYGFKNRVERIYGTPEITDQITDPETYYKKENQWLDALEKGARRLYAEWRSDNKKVKLKDDLCFICLYAESAGFDKTKLIIEYAFINVEKAEDNEDEVL